MHAAIKRLAQYVATQLQHTISLQNLQEAFPSSSKPVIVPATEDEQQ